jgi:hypothetical protein
MFHPLLSSPSALKTQELEDKINELTRKYFIAAKSGNGSLAQQVLVALETYKAELQHRNLTTKIIPSKNGDTGLDDLIKVT